MRKPDLRPGDVVRLVRMPKDPDPIRPGTVGIVSREPVLVGGSWVVGVRWTDGRRLNLSVPPDEYEKVEGP